MQPVNKKTHSQQEKQPPSMQEDQTERLAMPERMMPLACQKNAREKKKCDTSYDASFS
jgi:hypothetical protein